MIQLSRLYRQNDSNSYALGLWMSSPYDAYLYTADPNPPQYTYQPYGTSTQTGSIASLYRFTGREWDGATGMQYNRARYHKPTWGRFVSEGPPCSPLHAFDSLRAYGGDSPHSVNPWGLDPMLRPDPGCGLIGRRCWTLNFNIMLGPIDGYANIYLGGCS